MRLMMFERYWPVVEFGNVSGVSSGVILKVPVNFLAATCPAAAACSGTGGGGFVSLASLACASAIAIATAGGGARGGGGGGQEVVRVAGESVAGLCTHPREWPTPPC